MRRATCGTRGWLLFGVLLGTVTANAQVTLPENLGGLTANDVTQAAIALVNFSSAPGISGANFNANRDAPGSTDIVRSNLGFETDITLRNTIFDGFIAAYLGAATIDEKFTLISSTGEAISFDSDRSIISARVSGGLSFPISEHLRIKPYLSGLIARYKSDTTVIGTLDINALPPQFQTIIRNNTFKAAGGGGTLDITYDRWFGSKRLQFIGKYNLAYTDIYDSTDDLFKTSGTSQTISLLGRYSDTTNWIMANRAWRWNAYVAHVNFVDQSKKALGFTYYYTVGAGLIYEWNLKPLNWFGIRFVGLQGGVIIGDDVDGWTLGISFQ